MELSKHEISLLKRFGQESSVIIEEQSSEFCTLRDKNLILPIQSGVQKTYGLEIPTYSSTEHRISREGERILENISDDEKRTAKEDKRWRITTSIAVAAIILSLASLIWQGLRP